MFEDMKITSEEENEKFLELIDDYESVLFFILSRHEASPDVMAASLVRTVEALTYSIAKEERMPENILYKPIAALEHLSSFIFTISIIYSDSEVSNSKIEDLISEHNKHFSEYIKELSSKTNEKSYLENEIATNSLNYDNALLKLNSSVNNLTNSQEFLYYELKNILLSELLLLEKSILSDPRLDKNSFLHEYLKVTSFMFEEILSEYENRAYPKTAITVRKNFEDIYDSGKVKTMNYIYKPTWLQ